MKNSINIIRALNQPWLIDPNQADKWASFALEMLKPGAVATPISGANEESTPYIKDNVFVLPVNGPLMKYENCGSPGTANMVASLLQANANDNVEAIVLQIDSPGGTVDGTKVFADAVKNSKKPVVAYVDGLMASAAMWIGSAAKQIVASTKTDMVGSIGTMVQWADFTEAYKAKGITVHEAYATQSVDKNKIFKTASGGNYTELITSMLDPINNEFLGAIKQNRAGKINLSGENVLTGKVYMAADAVKHGLVDSIGTLDSAIKSAKALASSKKIKMENTNTAFKNVLVVAGAESFELVDNIGFALTEDQLNKIDAKLVADAATIAANQTAIDNAGTALTEAQGTITSQAEEITQLKAQVEKYKPLKAKVIVDPVAAADPVQVEENKYETSVDAELKRLHED